MQEKNRTYKNPPQRGDGTQPSNEIVPEANWFGTAQEPQDEYIENDPPIADPNANQRKMSEGRPTFSGSAGETPTPTDLPPHANDALRRK